MKEQRVLVMVFTNQTQFKHIPNLTGICLKNGIESQCVIHSLKDNSSNKYVKEFASNLGSLPGLAQLIFDEFTILDDLTQIEILYQILRNSLDSFHALSKKSLNLNFYNELTLTLSYSDDHP